MPTPEDALFGRIAIHMHLAAQEHVAFCLQLQAHDQAAGQPRRSLGQIMVERGYITPPQVNLILEEQKRRGGPKMIGPYEVVGKLGEGGMGAVYRARVPQTGAEVALKVLPRKHADNAAFISRFDREARIGMELEHPNIVRTLDMGEDHGVHFMALEVVEGGDVRKLLKERNILTESEALGIARDVAFALQYAHERGLVHRDVKPANIMFDREGRTRLSDFGLVKQTDPEASHLTQTGYMVGTAHYIAPEQARGQKDVDIRADIYALGATLYHMVTGQTPFSGDTPMAVMAKHLSEELTAPDEINPSLGDGCVSLIEKMMAKDREDRYATPGDAAYDMECVLRGEEPEGATLGEGSSSVKVSPKRQARVRQRFEAIKARPERPRGRTRTSQQKIVPPERGGTPGRGIPARRSSAQIVPLEVPPEPQTGQLPERQKPSRRLESKHSVRLTGPVVFMVLGVMALGVGVGMVLNAGDPETPYGHGQIPASKAKTEDVSGKAPPERPKTAFLDASKTAHAPPKEPEVSGAREDYARKQLDLLLMEQRAGKTAPDALRRKFEDFLRSYSTTKAGQEAATVLKALPAAPLPPEVTEKIGLPFKATFDASLKGWRVFDVSGLKEGPSRWVGKGSSVVQETNAFGPPLTVDGRDVGGGGSHLILQGGEFREGKLQLHVLPNDDDGLGVLFHHRDEANYYRFYMRAESRLATLICLSHGQITELARSFFAYNPRTAKEVEILWGAGRMQVLVDKRDLFGIVPEPPPASNQGGTVGLGSYGNAGGSYGDLRVDPLLAAERQALLDGKLLSPGSSTASTGRESPYTARWSKLALDGPGPGRRPYLVTAMTYDRKRKRSVLYGGEYQNDLWALDLDAHKWTCLLPNDPKGPETGKTRPPATIQHNFHYDEGQDLYWLNFAWCYDPNAKTWQEQKQLIRNAQVPINSINQGMLYDPDGKRFLINGDGGQSNIWFFLYPGDRKIEPLPSVTPAWVWRYGGLFYDSTRKAFVVFPCVNFGDDTWVLDAKTRQWRELRPEVRPQPRTYHRLVFDERLGVGVMAGGRDKDNKSFMDLWVYETAAERWIAVPYQGEAPSGDAACAATAYDAAHDVTVYLDGNGNTWTLELKLNAAIPTKTVVPEAALVTEPSKPATPSSDGPGIGEVGHTDADGWITAFNGKDLQGWGVYNEPARVEAGAMVLEGKSDIGWRLNREDYEIRGQLQVERASASNYFGTIKLHRAGGAIASLALKADGGVSCAQDNNKIQEAPGVLKPMQWQSFQLRVVNGRLDFSLAGKEILTSAVPKVMATMLNLFGSFDAKQSSRWRLKELAWRPLDAGGKPVRLPAAKEAGQKDPEGWVCLFNERDLSGWETLRGKPQAAEGALHLKGADEISLPLAETDFEVRGEVQLYDKAPNQHVGSLAIRRPGKDRKGGLLLAWFWDGTLQLKDENDKVIAKSNGAKTGVWQPFVIRAKGAEVGVDVDGRTVMTAKTAPTGAGNLALYGPEAGLSHFAFRNLSYRSPQSVAAPEKAPEPAPSPPPSTSTQSIPAPKAAKDSILWETWNAIPGPAVASLTQHYAYPYFPMEARELTSFETPANHGDNFGARVCGFVHPPLDGSYVFWIASDDESQLWLSTDEDRKHLRKIAEVKGYRGVREWEKDGGQKSAAIPLKAGQRYRIEALHKEGAGEDHLAVGWQLPDGTQERPIPGSRLSSGTPLNWVTLDIATASSKKTETQFIKQKDGSILVSGAVLRNDTYAIATRPNLKNIVAIRLDVLPDETLPARGPGRADNGNFVLTDLKVFADGRLIEIQNARSDYSQNGYSVSNAIDDKADTGWAVGGQLGKPHSATFEPVQPFHAVSLGFLLAHDSEHLNYNIGRFRISVAADPEGKP